MNSVQLSQNAINLIDWVQTETNKPIIIDVSNDIGANMLASFTPDPDNIKIKVTERLSNYQQDVIDQSICHEAIHGLLLHKHGYYFPTPVNNPDQEIRMSINICMTMIDDIVVNKILADKGMQPFSPLYLPMVKEEIDAINNNTDLYEEHLAIGNHFYERFKIFRYIMACGFLKYFQLSSEHGKLISRFTKYFERYSRNLMPEAKQIIMWIDANDIFTPQGHRTVVENILKMWDVSKFVKFFKYNSGDNY